MQKQTYRKPGSRFNFDFYPEFLSSGEADSLFSLIERKIRWNRKITPGLRVNQTYGDPGVSYTLHIRGTTIVRKATDWNTFPELFDLKCKVEEITDSKYNYCVIQRYPSGKVGIKKHRDREMTSGTTIAGLSIGAQRELIMYPDVRAIGSFSNKPINIKLNSGSLYVFNPPTNDYWLHSIEPDLSISKPRISITFRTWI
jgi:hypothetical protein